MEHWCKKLQWLAKIYSSGWQNITGVRWGGGGVDNITIPLYIKYRLQLRAFDGWARPVRPYPQCTIVLQKNVNTHWLVCCSTRVQTFLDQVKTKLGLCVHGVPGLWFMEGQLFSGCARSKTNQIILYQYCMDDSGWSAEAFPSGIYIAFLGIILALANKSWYILHMYTH